MNVKILILISVFVLAGLFIGGYYLFSSNVLSNENSTINNSVSSNLSDENVIGKQVVVRDVGFTVLNFEANPPFSKPTSENRVVEINVQIKNLGVSAISLYSSEYASAVGQDDINIFLVDDQGRKFDSIGAPVAGGSWVYPYLNYGARIQPGLSTIGKKPFVVPGDVKELKVQVSVGPISGNDTVGYINIFKQEDFTSAQSNYTSNSIIIQAPFGVRGEASESGISFDLRNGAGQNVIIHSVEISGCGVNNKETIIASGNSMVFDIPCTLSSGSVFQGNIKITWRPVDSTLNQITTGSIYYSISPRQIGWG